MAIKQISVFLENKPGMLDAMTAVLADAGRMRGSRFAHFHWPRRRTSVSSG